MSIHLRGLERAKQSLQGLSVADAFGSHFEAWRAGINQNYIRQRRMPDSLWHFTDDTEMALSIYAILRRFEMISQNDLAASFAEHFDESRAYGTGAIKLLKSIRAGEDWRIASKDLFRGEGSFGNGAAMRAAPIGAYFAENLDELIKNAKLSAEVTHSHPEGIAGAIAVALAASVSNQLQNPIDLKISDFFDRILTYIPESELRDNCVLARNLAENISTDEAAKQLGNGRNVTAMDTVPIALWVAFKHLDNFEEAMWQLASIGGDVDTTCAITGGIIAAFSLDSIPNSWIAQREELPKWAFEDA
jgi:ADP-ribosylglycohydrolase